MKKRLLFYSIICCVLTVKYTHAQTQVTFYTSMGKFVVQMYDKERPITTTHILGLIKKKFYDKVIFHRVIDNFMIQGGDPTGTGSGGSGTIIKDELTIPNNNLPKTIAMANSGPNTGDSQFFINLVTNAHLDSKHPVFGIVISNFEVVQAIGKVKKDSKDKPIVPVVMDSVRITPPITGIEEAENLQDELTVFPNPVTLESSIFINATVDKTAEIMVYNQQGQLLGNRQEKLLKGGNIISLKEIPDNHFTSGMYYLMVNDGKSIRRKKFVVAQ